ncbi:MAG: LD-carboxypeptidase [Erysipelotrichaceae bacterium]|nr:LD-carboxypeptidase [Erysipelotrichaceae bacterium]
MIYPEFLKEKGTIGICAPSAGVGRKLEEFETSNEVLKSLGYNIKETASVRVNNPRSASARKRAKELEELFKDESVDFIMCAAGGDFMLEMMEYVDFDVITQNPKWISGMSDPTNILFPITTMLDIATIYGRNGAGFTFEKNRSQSDFLNFIKGKIVKQHSYKKFRTFLDEIEERKVYHDVRWIAKKEAVIEGRLIGGCIESISKLIGTKFDHTNEFIDRYAQDGIVWYFDIFDMSSYNFYLTLLQFKNAGWFRNCRGVLISRPAFPNIEDKKLDYIKAADKALGKIPHILEMDIGHTSPNMTLINGALVKVEYKDNKGSISFKLNRAATK